MQKLTDEERKTVVAIVRALWVAVATCGRFIKNGNADTCGAAAESFEVSQSVNDLLKMEE